MKKIIVLIFALLTYGITFAQTNENILRMPLKTTAFGKIIYPNQLVTFVDTNVIFRVDTIISAANTIQTTINNGWISQVIGANDTTEQAFYKRNIQSVFGYNSGDSSLANYAFFSGYLAGDKATNANASNFLGRNAGREAINANYSLFSGISSGYQATNAGWSNFFGNSSGYQATNLNHTNAFGNEVAFQATDAYFSNFFGMWSGRYAYNARFTNAMGLMSCDSAINASYSNLFGFQVGKYFTGNQIGSNNIIIGTNITLPNLSSNSMNFGGVLFATGTYADTTGNPSKTPSINGKIGIGVVIPSEQLEVAQNIKCDTIKANVYSGISVTTPTLDQVTDAGNTTTNNIGCDTIKANVLGLIDASSGNISPIKVFDNSLYLRHPNGFDTKLDYSGNGTKDNNYIFPDTSGTIALMSDVVNRGFATKEYVDSTNKTIQKTDSLLVANWTLVSGIYEYDLTNTSVTTSKIVDIIPTIQSFSYCQLAEIYPNTLSGSGTVKLYSKYQPIANIYITLNIKE